MTSVCTVIAKGRNRFGPTQAHKMGRDRHGTLPGEFAGVEGPGRRRQPHIAARSRTSRCIVCDLLRQLRIAQAEQAEDGADAMAKLRGFPADLVICDLHMAPLDGIEFTRLLRDATDSPKRLRPGLDDDSRRDRNAAQQRAQCRGELFRVQTSRDGSVARPYRRPVLASDGFRARGAPTATIAVELSGGGRTLRSRRAGTAGRGSAGQSMMHPRRHDPARPGELSDPALRLSLLAARLWQSCRPLWAHSGDPALMPKALAAKEHEIPNVSDWPSATV